MLNQIHKLFFETLQINYNFKNISTSSLTVFLQVTIFF